MDSVSSRELITPSTAILGITNPCNLKLPQILDFSKMGNIDKILFYNQYTDNFIPQVYVYKSSTKNVRSSQEQTLFIKTDKYLNASLALCLYPEILHNYCLSYQQMFFYGYPVPSLNFPGSVMIFKAAPKKLSMRIPETLLYSNICKTVPMYVSDVNYTPVNENSIETHKCVRCNQEFSIKNNSEYVDECNFCSFNCINTNNKNSYVWGKSTINPDKATNQHHVWNGLYDGLNEPLNDFVRTRPCANQNISGSALIYSLDCEMCYTAAGLELTKTTLVNLDGLIAYESFVKPENPIVDYNTRFSGIVPEDLNSNDDVKTLQQVQNDLLGYISEETLLIGHGLENDLRALKLMHCKVIDTSILFPHLKGLPYKCSLKSLASNILNRNIQNYNSGHKSFEDAHTCMELVLWRVLKDLKILVK